MRMRRAAGAMLAAWALAGCGDSPQDVVSDTADKLAEVRSGELDMRFALRPDAPAQPGMSVQLRGPFMLPRGNELPTARIEYVQALGETTTSATLTSTPGAAFVRIDGIDYRLPAGEAGALRGRGGRGAVTVDALHVDEWIEQPRLTEAGSVQRVRGQLDVVAALRDVSEAVRAAGGSMAEVTDAQAKTLRDAVRSSSVELVTGREDRFLQRLRGVAVLDVPANLRTRLTGAGVRVSFELRLRSVNRPVSVRAPADAQPLPAGGVAGAS